MPKVKVPKTFNSKQSKLKKFLIQCDIYFQLREADFEVESDKVLFIVGLIRGTALDQIEPVVRDYLDKIVANQALQTRTIFIDYNVLKQELEHIFRDLGEKRRVELIIISLQQWKSVTEYVAKFKQLLAKAGWDDIYTMLQYYKGLKELVKERLSYRATKLATLQELMLIT